METAHALSRQVCLYLYGVLAAAQLDLSGLKGMEDESEVFLVSCGELACAVSVVSSGEYHQDIPADASAQLEWVAPRAVRHHEVVQHLSRITTVVPLKFGTLCSTPERVQQILRRLHQPLTTLLAQFQGKQEWAVRVWAQQEALQRELEQTGSQLSDLEQEASRLSEGQAYFLRKKKQRLAAELLAQRISLLDEEILARLLPCAVEAVRMRAGSKAPQVELLSAALLLEEEKLAALEKTLEEIESDYSRYGAVAELSGPWPPYNFCRDLEEFEPYAT